MTNVEFRTRMIAVRNVLLKAYGELREVEVIRVRVCHGLQPDVALTATLLGHVLESKTMRDVAHKPKPTESKALCSSA